eukprot:scaffold122546_cov21-Tisochrysis_lutea.AAC.1
MPVTPERRCARSRPRQHQQGKPAQARLMPAVREATAAVAAAVRREAAMLTAAAAAATVRRAAVMKSEQVEEGWSRKSGE